VSHFFNVILSVTFFNVMLSVVMPYIVVPVFSIW